MAAGCGELDPGHVEPPTLLGRVVRLDALAAASRLGAVEVVRHDIGSMAAYGFAARCPAQVGRLVLLDVAPPAIGTFADNAVDGSTACPWWSAWHRVPGLQAGLAGGDRIRHGQDRFFRHLTGDDAGPDVLRTGDARHQAFQQDVVVDDVHPKIAMLVRALGGPGGRWLSGAMPAEATGPKVVRLADGDRLIAEAVPDAQPGPIRTTPSAAGGARPRRRGQVRSVPRRVARRDPSGQIAIGWSRRSAWSCSQKRGRRGGAVGRGGRQQLWCTVGQAA